MSLSGEMQALAIAFVAILDTAEPIAALTGRADENLVRGWPTGAYPNRVLVYDLGEATQSVHGDEGENWDVPVQLTAIAETQAAAAALLAAAEELLTTRAFELASVDATVMETEAGDAGPIETDDGERLDRYGAQAELTVWVTKLDL